MYTTQIVVGLDLNDPIESVPKEQQGPAMTGELQRFEAWFKAQGNSPLVRAEQAILRTYLAWKLLHEKRDMDSPLAGGDDG